MANIDAHHKNNVLRLIKVLNSAFDHLPIETSLIAYEVILIAMKFHVENEELPLKVIFSNKNFTEMGARYHLNRLIKNGWLDSERSQSDLRVRIIRPTKKLICAYNEFEKFSAV